MGLTGLPRILLLLQGSPLPAPPPSGSRRNTTYFLTHWHSRDKESMQLLPLRTQDFLDVPGLGVHKHAAPFWRQPSFQSWQAPFGSGNTETQEGPSWGGCLEVWRLS